MYNQEDHNYARQRHSQQSAMNMLESELQQRQYSNSRSNSRSPERNSIPIYQNSNYNQPPQQIREVATHSALRHRSLYSETQSEIGTHTMGNMGAHLSNQKGNTQEYLSNPAEDQ